MIIGHEDGFAVGSGRYGSRSNSAFRCEKCGHAKANHSGEGCDRGDCDCNGFSDTRENADEKGQSFKCDQCKDEFWTRQSLAEHKANVHGGRKNADMPPTESELRERHAKEHKGRFLDCKICEKIAGGERENSDPVARHENARAAGQERYGSRNMVGPGEDLCADCGHDQVIHRNKTGPCKRGDGCEKFVPTFGRGDEA